MDFSYNFVADTVHDSFYHRDLKNQILPSLILLVANCGWCDTLTLGEYWNIFFFSMKETATDPKFVPTNFHIVAVQSLCYVRLFVTPWTAAHQAFLSFTISQNLFKFMSIELVMPCNHLILCHPLLLLSSIFPSFRVFSNKSSLHITCQSIGASVSLLLGNIQNWFPLGLTGWISLLSKGLSRVFSNTTNTSSKSSVLLHAAFLMVQLSHQCMTTGKAITLTRWTFVGKIMSLLFNTLSRLVIAFLPRSNLSQHSYA